VDRIDLNLWRLARQPCCSPNGSQHNVDTRPSAAGAIHPFVGGFNAIRCADLLEREKLPILRDIFAGVPAAIIGRADIPKVNWTH
jgi:hypothetical protein